MNKFGFFLVAAVGLAGVGHAADLPTTKGPAPTLAPGCFASFWTWLDSTAADCPLSYAGFTVYATLDAGLGYYSQGAAWNPAVFNGTQGLISKQSNGSKWLWSPNNINQSVIGIQMSEPISYDWSIIGTVEAGFDPISGELANSQRSQVMNNGKALVLQSANGDSSRAGQWDNSQGFIGFTQLDLWHVDRRARQHAIARRPHRLRSDGQRLRVLPVRLHRHVCRVWRH